MTPYAPDRIRTRPYHFMRELMAQGHCVTLAAVHGGGKAYRFPADITEGVDSLVAEHISQLRSAWNCLRAIPTSYPLQACYSWSPLLARRLSSLATQGRFDVIHVEHLRGVRYALHLKQTQRQREAVRAPIIWDTVDCIGGLFRQTMNQSCTFRSRLAARIEVARTERFEGWLAAQFDRVLITSEPERLKLLKLVQVWSNRFRGAGRNEIPGSVAVVPNGVDLDYFTPSIERRKPLTLVISGKMSYHANVTAVVRFVQNVLPRVWAELPGVRLWIVGKDPPAEIRRLGVPWAGGNEPLDCQSDKSRVQITGTVDDIRPYLRGAALAVAPIRYGAGVQNKILESLACGAPVVATTQAVMGLKVAPGRDLVTAETDQDFASCILALLRDADQRTELGRAGRQYVEREHDWHSIAQQLTDIYCHAISLAQTCATPC